MRVEINVNDPEVHFDNQLQQLNSQAPSCDVAIDIGQVLAANQALLKNMARKMEAMENRLKSMETACNEQTRLLLAEKNTTLLLAAPLKEVKPWNPPEKELDTEYFNRFSAFDRFFRPWVMRRNHN